MASYAPSVDGINLFFTLMTKSTKNQFFLIDHLQKAMIRPVREINQRQTYMSHMCIDIKSALEEEVVFLWFNNLILIIILI